MFGGKQQIIRSLGTKDKERRASSSAHGSMIHEDDYHWSMDNGSDDAILVVPKLGEVLAIEVMDSLLHKAKMNDRTYFELLAKIE